MSIEYVLLIPFLGCLVLLARMINQGKKYDRKLSEEDHGYHVVQYRHLIDIDCADKVW